MRYVNEPSAHTVGVIERVQEYRDARTRPSLDNESVPELSASVSDICALVDEVFRLRGFLEHREESVRADERRRLAELLAKHKAVLEASHPDGLPLDLVKLLLTLGDQ